MRVHLLIGHYKESYPGQHAPNVFLACDEYILDDNPSWWPENVAAEKAKCGSDVAAWAEIIVEVSAEAMLDALYPSRKPIAATVVSTHPEPHVGGWVKDAWGDDVLDEETSYGLVTAIVDGGYSVIWEADDSPKFAAADEVVYVDLSEVPKTRTWA